MLGSRHKLLERIRLGEDSLLELKEVRFAGSKIRGPTQNDLADELAAFANTRGATIVVGVRDKTREVVGIPLERLDSVEGLVCHACENSMKPPGVPVIERMPLPDGSGVQHAVIRVEIAQSLFIHQSPGGYYQRTQSSKRPIIPDRLARLFQHRSQARLIRFDGKPVPRTTIGRLDQTLWQRFTAPTSSDTPEQLLSKMAMAARDANGTLRPTVAGLLMASRAPQHFVPNAFIQAVAYRGKEILPQPNSSYQRDARDITGPLDQQIFDACDFVYKNMRISARKGMGGGREDIPQFDMLSVFEAVTNAVAHRDYSVAGSKVRLRLFDDRMELYSPGCLVNTMTPETLPFRQAARNETIASLLARCPVEQDSIRTHRARIMDRRGEGVPVILSRSEQLSGRKPKYRLIDESELLLTIYAA